LRKMLRIKAHLVLAKRAPCQNLFRRRGRCTHFATSSATNSKHHFDSGSHTRRSSPAIRVAGPVTRSNGYRDELSLGPSSELRYEVSNNYAFHQIDMEKDHKINRLMISGNITSQLDKFFLSHLIKLFPMWANKHTLNIRNNLNSMFSQRRFKGWYIADFDFDKSFKRLKLPVRIKILAGCLRNLKSAPPPYFDCQKGKLRLDFLGFQFWQEGTSVFTSAFFVEFLQYSSFNSASIMKVFQKIREKLEIKEHCPSKCKCSQVGLREITLRPLSYEDLSYDPNNWKPMLEVNCNNVSLTKIPTQIPKHTTLFQASYNNITDINEIFENDLYLNIGRLLMDHNQIKSIDGYKLYKYLVKRNPDFALDLSHNQLEEEGIGRGCRNGKCVEDASQCIDGILKRNKKYCGEGKLCCKNKNKRKKMKTECHNGQCVE
ncbi:unnamed protein product, partial [Meganyctiphanes norvegica]